MGLTKLPFFFLKRTNTKKPVSSAWVLFGVFFIFDTPGNITNCLLCLLENIKVNSDKAQDPVKIKVIEDSKNLYVATARDSKALYAKINCPADADDETKKKAIRNQYLSEYGTEIGWLIVLSLISRISFTLKLSLLTELANKVALDMLVLGAVVASQTGQRIGRGNGYVDLDFGILSKSGAITDNTIIVATVHDEQVN